MLGGFREGDSSSLVGNQNPEMLRTGGGTDVSLKVVGPLALKAALKP